MNRRTDHRAFDVRVRFFARGFEERGDFRAVERFREDCWFL